GKGSSPLARGVTTWPSTEVTVRQSRVHMSLSVCIASEPDMRSSMIAVEYRSTTRFFPLWVPLVRAIDCLLDGTWQAVGHLLLVATQLDITPSNRSAIK